MALTRSEAESFGLAFSHEDNYRFGADPDQPHYFADITLDGHTEHLQGKSEEDVLAQAERLLLSRGRIQRVTTTHEAAPLPTQSADVAESDGA